MFGGIYKWVHIFVQTVFGAAGYVIYLSGYVSGYRAPVKWWGNTHRGAQSAGITALATTNHVAADVAPIHKVLVKCFKRL